MKYRLNTDGVMIMLHVSLSFLFDVCKIVRALQPKPIHRSFRVVSIDFSAFVMRVDGLCYVKVRFLHRFSILFPLSYETSEKKTYKTRQRWTNHIHIRKWVLLWYASHLSVWLICSLSIGLFFSFSTLLFLNSDLRISLAQENFCSSQWFRCALSAGWLRSKSVENFSLFPTFSCFIVCFWPVITCRVSFFNSSASL